MEELNNLIKENEKLNARLSNAVNVFHEQKSTIERLTEERDSSKFELEKREKYIKELEAKVNEDNKDEQFFEQIQEINELVKKCETLEESINAQQKQIEKFKKTISEVKKLLSTTE